MKYALLLLCVSLYSSQYVAGRDLYFQKGCANCHGVQAEGSGTYPKLANNSHNSLIKNLKGFQNGKSNSQAGQIMFTFAKSLTNNELNNISFFLSNYKKDDSTKYEISDEHLGGLD